MNPVKSGNWWLHLLAMALAIVVYHVLKNESTLKNSEHDREIFQRP